MNIMILVVSYAPIIDSCSRLYTELSESLSERGHNVTVITEHPDDIDMVDEGHEYYLKKSSRKFLKGINVLRVSPLSFLSKIPGGKALRFFLSFLLFTFRGLCVRRPDVILVYSPPLYMGIAGYIISKAKNTRFVFNMQDIHPKVLFDSGAIKSKFIKRVLSKMETICYKKAYTFIVYSKGNKDYLVQRGVKQQAYIIPNWVDTHTVGASDRARSFRSEELIGNKFVVSYAGIIEQAQGLEVVVKVAEDLKECDNIIFLLAGEGSSKAALRNLIQEWKVKNVLLRPGMPHNKYMQFLYASDVCLISLSPDIPLPTVPGKLATIMACGRPVIAVVNQQGDAASIIKQAGCGFCVDPGDVEAFSHAVLKLCRDEGLRKKMGEKSRLFAEQHFSRTICTKRYEEVLCQASKGERFHQN
jgi:glycosyltransferase involved in cell wall biosynthesis